MSERTSQVSKERLQSFLRGCGIRHSRFRTWETHARAHACRATRNRAAADGRDCPTCRIAAYCESQAEEAEDATRERKERTDASARDFSRCVCVLVVSPILRRPPLTPLGAQADGKARQRLAGQGLSRASARRAQFRQPTPWATTTVHAAPPTCPQHAVSPRLFPRQRHAYPLFGCGRSGCRQRRSRWRRRACTPTSLFTSTTNARRTACRQNRDELAQD